MIGTAAYFRERLAYDPATGQLTWIARRRKGGVCAPGEVAGSTRGIENGYVFVMIEGRSYRAHQIAWMLMTGKEIPPGKEIDHMNGQQSDNRWSNLRLVSRSQNNMNAAPRSDNKSGYRGISWRKDTCKWHARINVQGKVILLGNFESLEDAVAARVAAERLHFGAHSFLQRRVSHG